MRIWNKKSDSREQFEEQDYSFVSKYKTQVSKQERARNLKSELFHSSITQESMVATFKFTGLEEAWNNLYAGYIQGVASNLVLSPSLEDEQRLSVGVLLTAVKS